MATEDDGLENYARVQDDQLKAKQVDLTPSAAIDCDECGIKIPLARKAAAPWAIRCIDCEEMHATKLKGGR